MKSNNFYGSRKKHGRSPFTENQVALSTYIRQWRSIYKPLEKAYGLKVIGYDPSILFKVSEYKCVDMPTDLAIKISKDIKELKKLREIV